MYMGQVLSTYTNTWSAFWSLTKNYSWGCFVPLLKYVWGIVSAYSWYGGGGVLTAYSNTFEALCPLIQYNGDY